MARKEDEFFIAVRELALAHNVHAFVVAGVVTSSEGELVVAGFGSSKFDKGRSSTELVHGKMKAVVEQAVARLASEAAKPPSGGFLN